MAPPTNQPREALVPSRAVYDRLRWDPRYDPRRCTVVYEDRARGDVEVPLEAFDPDGDVPWHRVQAFRREGVTLWDRRTRTDRLDEVAPAVGAAPSGTAEGFFVPTPAWRFRDRWEVAVDPADTTWDRPSLRLLTWNVLSDRHEPLRTRPSVRHDALVRSLRELDADVVALQEVTPRLVETLAGDPELRARYVFTDVPPSRSVGGLGPLVLSRVPVVRAGVHEFGPQKRCLAVDLSVHGSVWSLVVVHLSSDRAKDAAAKRADQLEALRTQLLGASPALVVGDFNLRAEGCPLAGFADLWELLRPGDPGFTFDPPRNPVAAATTLTGLPARFDRVLVREARAASVGLSVEIVGAEALPDEPELRVSDHYGVLATLRAEADPAALEGSAVHTSALAVVVPDGVSEPVQALRRKHDAQFGRWPPHLNVLYGFVPAARFDEAVRALDPLLARVEPFTLALDAFGRFAHRGSATVHLAPDASASERLRALESLAVGAFPACREQELHDPGGYRPHATVAQCATEDEARSLGERLSRGWRPLRWEVDRVHLLARETEGPFVTVHELSLGARDRALDSALAARGSLVSDGRRETLRALGSLLEDLARELGATARCVGSVAMGVADEGADLDVVLVATEELPREAWVERFRGAVEAAGWRPSWRTADEAFVPRTSFALEGVSVDLQVGRVRGGSLDAPATDLVARAADEPSRRSLEALTDCDAVLRAVGPRRRLFERLCGALRQWSSAQGLRCNAWGSLGGFAWTVLAAWACAESGRADAAGALAWLFASLRDRAWPLPVSLAATGFVPEGARDRWPVLTPSGRNAARNVTRSSAEALRAASARGATAFDAVARGGRGWDTLDEGASPEATGRWVVQADTEAHRDAVCGWMDGQALRWMLAIEVDPAAEVRSHGRWERAVGSASLPVSLRGGATAERANAGVLARFAAWTGRPSGASLRWE